jgi:hypothetical protein
MLIVILFATVSVICLLILFGIIGPQRLRNRMRKFITWYYRDAALFGPIDPYAPIAPAVKEQIHNFWPTKERVRNAVFLALLIIAIAILSVFATLIILIITLSLHGYA